MKTKIAGNFSLQSMVESALADVRTKLASADEKDKAEKKMAPPFMKKDDKGEKKEEKKEGDKEKKSSAGIDFSDADDLNALTEALDFVGEKIAADASFMGGESHQGGETLPTMKMVAGKQPYKHDKSKAHNVPMSTGMQAGDAKSATTQVPNDHAKAPGGSPFPKKGVMKTAAEGVMAKIEAAKKKGGDKKEEKKEEKKEKDEGSEKKSSAEFIISKLAEMKGGGETLDSKSGAGPKPSNDSKGGNNVRSHIESNQAAINMKKVDGKAPQKKMLSEVLTEPAMSKSHDSKVHENLRNASKGGVKIAAVKAYLQKIASDEKDPRHEQLKKALEKKKMEKKSMGGMSASPSMPPPPPAM